MNPIILELLIQGPIKLTPEGQQAVISAYDIAVKNGFVGTELEWLQTVQNIQSPITAEVLAAAAAAASSALAAGDSEQVAIEKAAEVIELAQAVLALRNQAEGLANASGSFATDSGISANNSNTARLLSEAAKEIAIQEAGKSSTSAGQSAESAADAEAAKNLILNKAEVNITTAGHVLLADGTVFKSVPDRDLGANLSLYQRTPLLFDKPSILELYDNCERIGTTSNEPMGQADSGQSYVNLVGSSGKYNGLSRNLFSNTANGDIIGIENVNVLPNVFLTRSGFVRIGSGARSGIYFYVDANNWVFFGISANSLLVITKVSGVETIVKSVASSVVMSRAQLKMHFFLAPQNGGYGLTIPDANLTCFIGSESSTVSLINQATAIGFSGTIYNYSITVAKTF